MCYAAVMDEHDPFAMRPELIERYARSSDPELTARRQEIRRFLMNEVPGFREIVREGRLQGLFFALRRVLHARGITLSTADEERLAKCSDDATLLRWIEQASKARGLAEALR